MYVSFCDILIFKQVMNINKLQFTIPIIQVYNRVVAYL